MSMDSKLWLLLGWAMILPVAARTWTDKTGRKIEADLVRVEGTKVVLKLRGNEVPLELAKLCEEDRTFIAEWKTKEGSGAAAGGGTPTAPAGELTLCGTALKPDGAVTTVEEPLSAAALKRFSKAKQRPAKLKIAVALPPGFDPAKPPRVMWVSAAINTDEDRVHGNIGIIEAYAPTATAAGWVTIAADTDLGNPRGEDNQRSAGEDLAVHQNAIETLAKAWPKFKTWEFACCGYSGGAKASYYRVGDLLASNLTVIGMFLVGCNQDMTADAVEETRCHKAGLRKIKVFLSNGKSDEISTPAHAATVTKSMKAAGYGTVQLATFDGGHNINDEEFKKALTWFVEPGGKPTK